jgi:steroid 5-alpha reductase family enzyme
VVLNDLVLTMPWAPGAGLALAALWALGAITWAISVPLKDASIADRIWPLFFALALACYLFAQPTDPGLRAWLVGALVLAWAARLGIFITRRNWGHGEDRRYQAMRARNEPFAWRSLYIVFGLQATLAWVLSWPMGLAVHAQAPLHVLDVLGLALGTAGLLIEALGDAQMARFKANPANQGCVMDQGLWAWSRHPNYFGEACVWWGVWLVALAAAPWQALWLLPCPVLLTFLLLKVSGVALLEQDIGERRPGYREYIAHTPAFFPRPPRQRAPNHHDHAPQATRH